jgi:ribose 5-phosphate isomerase A
MSTASSTALVEVDAFKRAAAEAAVQMVESDMIVGLGSGSTAAKWWTGLVQKLRYPWK